MKIPLTVPMWIMAALPILLLIVCMTVLKWSAVKAALVGMCVSLIGGAVGFVLLSNVSAPMVGASGALFGLIGAIVAWEYDDLRAEGASVMHLAVDAKLAGILAVSDPVKTTTADALASLRRANIRVVMATGDGLTTAQAVGKRLGIEEVHGEVKPADKLKLVEKLQSEGRIVAMAGDGINDAPALARADVGIAMGTGTDVAMNSAQLTLVKGDLRGIATARALSVATVANMKQNLAFAFVYNALGVPLAAGVLFPFTGWLLSPMIAALAMSLSSASVITNALRLRSAALKPD